MYINKKYLGIGLIGGASVGLIFQTGLFEDFNIPYLDTILPDPFYKASVFLPMVVGVSGIVAGLFVKNDYKAIGYGLAVGGLTSMIINYFFPKTTTVKSRVTIPRNFNSNRLRINPVLYNNNNNSLPVGRNIKGRPNRLNGTDVRPAKNSSDNSFAGSEMGIVESPNYGYQQINADKNTRTNQAVQNTKPAMVIYS